MATYIKQGDIFGRIGSGLGRGLGEQLPKEIERGRLAAGLEKLGNQQGRTPFQQFTALASTPGITPQMIQSGSELLRQQGMLQGAGQPSSTPPNQFDAVKNRPPMPQQNPSVGLVGTENTGAALKPAIPKSLRELQDRAYQLHKENPALYPDWNAAFQGAQNEDTQRIAQNTAQKGARQTQKGVESDIRGELRRLQSAANAKLPDSEYQAVENKAIDDIRNGEDELTATKKARDELDAISRDYSKLDAIGGYTPLGSNPKESINSIKSLRTKFAKRGPMGLENFADAIVARIGTSNEYGHSLAMPPRQEIIKFIRDQVYKKGTKAFPELAKMINKEDSPLAIAHMLRENEHDADRFREYLINNKRELDLSERQVRELEKVDSIGQGYLNDAWLKFFGGGD